MSILRPRIVGFDPIDVSIIRVPFAPPKGMAIDSSPMPRIHIGTRSLQGKLERYAQKFDLLEVRPDADAPLRPATLRRWRKAVPPTFVFSVVLPVDIAQLRAGPSSDELLRSSLDAARILESPIVVLATPPSVTPTAANRKRLAELVERIPHDVVRIAWEPSGLWEADDTIAIAKKLGLVLVRDPARETVPAGPIAYVRLRGLGEASRLSSARASKVAERLSAFRESFVVVETDLPARAAKSLRERIEAESAEPRRVARTRAVGTTLRTEDEEQE